MCPPEWPEGTMSEFWDLKLSAPCTIALSRDRAFDRAFHLHGGDSSVLQITIGSQIGLRIALADGEEGVIRGEELGERILEGVVRITALTHQAPANDAAGPGEILVSEGVQTVADGVADPVAAWADLLDEVVDEAVPAAPGHESESARVDEPVAVVESASDDVAHEAVAEHAVNEHDVNDEFPRAVEPLIDAEDPVLDAEPDVAVGSPAGSAEPVAAEPVVVAETELPSPDPAPSQEQEQDFDATIPDSPASPAIVGGDIDDTVPGPPTPALSREADFAATVIGRALPAVLGGDLDATIVGPGPRAGQIATRRAAPLPARIRVMDAAGIVEHELSGVMYVGRAPQLPTEADPRRSSLVAVLSNGESVADTHAQLTAGDGLVLVRDLWSAGGTRVEQPTGGSFQLLPGEQIPIARGARILLGDGVVLETVG